MGSSKESDYSRFVSGIIMPQYTYISSKDYINNLAFHHVESYSLQRGAEFEATKEVHEEELDNLESKKDKQGHLTALEEKRFLELNALLTPTQYLIDDKGKFHPSSVKTRTFKATDALTARLKNILLTEVERQMDWMCAPVYRDALVFYDEWNRIVSVLNICLGCEYMETQKLTYVNGDTKTYTLLRQFFTDLGHEVEGE